MQKSWGTMLRTARAPVSVLVLGGAALLLPPQLPDVSAFLNNAGWRPVVVLYVSLTVLGGYAWYWSRAALAARFGCDDTQRPTMSLPHWRGSPRNLLRTPRPPSCDSAQFDMTAFIWLPRLTIVGGFSIGWIMAWRDGTWRILLGILVLSMLAVLLAAIRGRGRKRVLEEPLRFHGLFSAPATAWQRFRILLAAAPYGPVPAATLLFLGMAPLLGPLIRLLHPQFSLPVLLAGIFPGADIALLLLGLMIAPLTVVTFVCDGVRIPRLLLLRRLPVLTLVAAYVFVVVPYFWHVHTVRLQSGHIDKQASLPSIFAAWAKADVCGPQDGAPLRPIIVAISGGATRAGLWGEAVLDQVLRAQQPGGPRLFAVSSVSGGSVGAAAAMSLLAQETGRPCTLRGLPSLRPGNGAPVPLAGDVLGPLLAGWLLDDVPRAFVEPVVEPIRRLFGARPNGGDSAQAIEMGFDKLWRRVQPHGDGWEAPYLSLFYKYGAYRDGMPLWLANGTDATTGNRVITTPLRLGKEPVANWPFRGARDFHEMVHADVAISTAINNTARFPYLEPFGEMLPIDSKDTGESVGSLIDGGYFENEGLQTALDLADWLIAHPFDGRRVEPIIVEATGDGEADVDQRSVMTCANASDGAGIPGLVHASAQLLEPFVGLYHVRGGHSAALLREARDRFCAGSDGKVADRFFHFYLPGYVDPARPSAKRRDIPLNWLLSDELATFIWTAFTDTPVCNATQLYRLKMALYVPATGVAPPAAPKGAGCGGGETSQDMATR